MPRVTGAVSATVVIATDVVVVLFAALYIAAQPGLYLAGFSRWCRRPSAKPWDARSCAVERN